MIIPFDLYWEYVSYQKHQEAQCSDNADEIIRLCNILDKAIDEFLEGRQKEYLKLKYYDGLKQCEIAALYGVKPCTVSRTIARARQNIERVVGLHLSYPHIVKGS